MPFFTDLPEDVIYGFMCGLPDFATLATVIKISKNCTYNLFQEHKRIILYTVAVNFLGVYLPHAFKLLRRVDEVERMQVPVDTLSSDTLKHALFSMTRYERGKLEDSLQTVATLEALLSQL